MNKKNLSHYMSLNYPVTISQDKEDDRTYFEAEIPDLPGCGAHGTSIEEALRNLEEAKRLWFRVSMKKGLSIPEPVSEEDFSGRVLLRIPARLHRQLSINAKKKEVSLNQYIRKKLESSLTFEVVLEKIQDLSERIEAYSKQVGKTKEYTPRDPKQRYL